MVTNVNLLFGDLATKMGFVTSKQVQECLAIQQANPSWRPLGTILVEQGYLTTEQLQTVLNIQKRNLEAKALQYRQLKDDNIFGRLAIKLGFTTEKRVDECLGVQLMIMEDYFLKLGEIMVKKGYLTEAQVQKILAYQETRIIKCACGIRYNVVLYNPGSQFFCYKCERELTVPGLPLG